MRATNCTGPSAATCLEARSAASLSTALRRPDVARTLSLGPVIDGVELRAAPWELAASGQL
eukprot:COSAG01_NODE_60892_length_292_cov_0.803109_1_plen_60_part_01